MGEYMDLDEVHMVTLAEWVKEFNSLVQEIGRHVIERAQSYYDARSIWQQAVQDFARQQDEVERINRDLEAAITCLSRAEAAFEMFLSSGHDELTNDDWEQLAPVKAGSLEASDEALQAADPKLRRALCVSRLGDRITFLQRQRDAAAVSMVFKRQELDDARRRFELEDLQHSNCTWNCSVSRAAPFYEKRRLHEFKVDQQLLQLVAVERQVLAARRRVSQLQTRSFISPKDATARSRSLRQLDELSLQSFEIAGGEPAQDEFLSCDEASGDEG